MLEIAEWQQRSGIQDVQSPNSFQTGIAGEHNLFSISATSDRLFYRLGFPHEWIKRENLSHPLFTREDHHHHFVTGLKACET